MDLRKFLMYQLSAAQSQVAAIETAIKSLDGAEPQEGPTEAPAPKTEKKSAAPAKKSKKVEAEPEFAGVETEEQPSDEADDMFGDDEAEEDQGPTLEDVRKVVKDFATKHGKEKALKLLGKFKVTSIPDIKKTDYARVIELAKKHM